MNIKKDKVSKSLKYSIIDGAFYSAMLGFGESFFSAFAVLLKATNTELGLLSSFPIFIGSLFELYSLKLLKIFKSRKLLVMTGVFLQALTYMLIIYSYFLDQYRVQFLILFSSLYFTFGLIIHPIWSSWISDLVHKNERGHFFGLRNEISGIVSFIAFVMGGLILQQFSFSEDTKYYGFIIIFVLAMLSRLTSLIFLYFKYEPKYTIRDDPNNTFISFIKNSNNNNFGLLVMYLSSINFAVYLAAPFFTVYMLKDLSFSYLQYTIVMSTSIIVKYLAMPIWGKFSDSYGTRKILSLAGFLMPLTPLLWIFSSNFYYLILIQIFSGTFWAAYELSAFNFLFDASAPKQRVSLIAYNNVVSGFAILFGSLFGAFIVNYNFMFSSDYLFVFFVSGVIRYSASFYYIPRLKEVRRVENVSYQRLFLNLLKLMPASGSLFKIVSIELDNNIENDEIIRQNKYIKYLKDKFKTY